MPKKDRAKKPLNHPDHVTALIEKGKEAMMKTQMKQMMKTIKQGIEGTVMAALGQAAESAPDLEGAAAGIANVAEKITTDIIAKATAVLAQHAVVTAAAPGKVVPMPFLPPVATPELQVAANGAPPAFIPPVVNSHPAPPPVFIPPKLVEDRGAPPPFIAAIPMPVPQTATAALEPVVTGVEEPRGTANDAKKAPAPVPPPFVPPTVSRTIDPGAPTPCGAKAAWPFTHLPGTTAEQPPSVVRKPGLPPIGSGFYIHVMNPLTGEVCYPVNGEA